MARKSPRKGSKTTHAVTGGCLGQLDLPAWPGFLTGVRVVEANVPRITRDMVICHDAVTFRIMLPPDLAPGTVVEWEDRQGGSWRDWLYTVVTASSAKSVTFAHAGRGPDGALEAARRGSAIRSAG
jgi:hypothetical protein